MSDKDSSQIEEATIMDHVNPRWLGHIVIKDLTSGEILLNQRDDLVDTIMKEPPSVGS